MRSNPGIFMIAHLVEYKDGTFTKLDARLLNGTYFVSLLTKLE